MKRDALPEWADAWLNGACGCGSRLVLVYDMTGASHSVCVDSGWDIDRCPDLVTTSRTDRQPPASASETNSGKATGAVR